MTTTLKVIKRVEVKTYVFEGIAVDVKIDYYRDTVSLVEREVNVQDYNKDTYKPKQWVFANRGREYLNPWIKIMTAMQHAVVEAQKELLAEDARVKKGKLDKEAVEIFKVLQEKGEEVAPSIPRPSRPSRRK